MVLCLMFSYSGHLFVLPVTFFAFWDLGAVSGALATEEKCRNVVEY